jgi:hypothetical protein
VSVAEGESIADGVTGLSGGGEVEGAALDSRVECEGGECHVEGDQRIEDEGDSAAVRSVPASGGGGASETTEVPNRENEANFDENVITAQTTESLDVTANSVTSSGLDNVAENQVAEKQVEGGEWRVVGELNRRVQESDLDRGIAEGEVVKARYDRVTKDGPPAALDARVESKFAPSTTSNRVTSNMSGEMVRKEMEKARGERVAGGMTRDDPEPLLNAGDIPERSAAGLHPPRPP